ncbi:alanine dehydrogenase, partial [Priestia endophytica]
MIIGVPKEVKNNENRVALTPAGVVSFINAGHEVLIEKDAGSGSGFTDRDYTVAGAQIVENVEDVWSQAEMIMKVK